jgi:hypothetical protein
MCYGRSLASGRMVDIGEAVGIIAAQSIGEPGTQLTMRTFHTGGVAGEDITHGLPRVVELFEARKPKGEAQITELSGTVAIEDDDEKHVRRITVTDDTGDMVEYPVSFRARLTVGNGDLVEVGQQLTEGSVNPHEKLRVEGVLALQQHLVDEVQQVYRSQGVTIHDKHIELIARQMLRKVHIIDPGETEYLPGDMVARRKFEEQNAEVVEKAAVPASARPVLLGITKASLATDSWLSAASFQETTRVLTDAAISAKSDPLLGLKENVIIGKLIPAGTGLSRYRNVGVKIKPDAIPEYWLARQRELREAVEEGTSLEPSLTGLTREQAEACWAAPRRSRRQRRTSRERRGSGAPGVYHRSRAEPLCGSALSASEHARGRGDANAPTTSSSAACTAGDPARMSPRRNPGPPFQSVTRPPASWISTAPAATSQEPSESSKNPSNVPSATHARSSGRRAGAPQVLEARRTRRGRPRGTGAPAPSVGTGSPCPPRLAPPLVRRPGSVRRARRRASGTAPAARGAQVASRNGAWTAPASGRPSSTRATETPTAQKPWMKFTVPSSGSTTQDRSASSPPRSSPSTGMSGVAASSIARIVRSLARSTSVT